MSLDAQLVLQFVVGLTFLSSATGKIFTFSLLVDGLRDYRILPKWSVKYAASVLIVAESAVAVSYLVGWQLSRFGLLALGLCSVFAFLTTLMLLKGMRVKCLCFGASNEEYVSARTIVRILLLAGLVHITRLTAQAAFATTARAVFLALATAISIQILASWILAAPELWELAKECRGCRHLSERTN